MYRYFILYKPFNVLSQFSSQLNKQTLADYINVSKDIYPVGRLDEDSEGLLILTNDTQINHRLLSPYFFHEREYYVQLDGTITKEATTQLQQGVTINLSGKLYTTKPCKAVILNEPEIAQRIPPVRYRKNVLTSWLKIVLTEGRNRQIRKMTAKVGFPVLRLIRYRIEQIELGNLEPGEMIELSKNSIYKKLFAK